MQRFTQKYFPLGSYLTSANLLILIFLSAVNGQCGTGCTSCQTTTSTCTACAVKYGLRSKNIASNTSTPDWCASCVDTNCEVCTGDLPTNCTKCTSFYELFNSTGTAPGSADNFTCQSLDSLYSVLKLIMVIILVSVCVICFICVVYNWITAPKTTSFLDESYPKNKREALNGSNAEAIGRDTLTARSLNDPAVLDKEKKFFELTPVNTSLMDEPKSPTTEKKQGKDAKSPDLKI